MLVNGAVITGKGAGAVKGRSTEETEQIRIVLLARFEDLNTEYEDAVAQNQKLRLVEIGDAAGDDQADSGSKTAERDAASSLIRTLLDRRTQAEHALQRLDDGTYGNCEGCHKPIPAERLFVFPSATTCVVCKSNRERRAA
jgi:DnaK suppressor protein